MKMVLAVISLTALVTVAEKTGAQMHYDPHFSLPGKAGTSGKYLGIENWELFGVYRYSLSDRLELGLRSTIDDFIEFAAKPLIGFDDPTPIFVASGAKWSLSEKSAVTASFVIPITGLAGDKQPIAGWGDRPDLTVGFMCITTVSDIDINSWLQIGLLDGYKSDNLNGIGLDLLVEPLRVTKNNWTGILDIMVSTNTEDITGSWRSVNFRPNVDYKLNDKAMFNVGVVFGVAGGYRQDPRLCMVYKRMSE